MRKLFLRILIVMACAAMVCVNLSSCGSKSDPSPNPTNNSAEAERVAGLLKSGTWKIQSVTVDGTDRTSLFTGFTLTFSDLTYTPVNGGPVWSTNSTWGFVGDGASSFVRTDTLVVGIGAISDSSLTLTLTWTKTTYVGGRAGSVAGKHTFVFTH